MQFFDAFNDIKIARYAADGITVDRHIKVPIKHSIKEKVYYWLNERKDDEILPMITAYCSSIDFATERKVNSFHAFSSDCTDVGAVSSTVSRYLHPTPYNLTFTMNIWALHMVDIDQIMEQILPFFGPHIFIRVGIPELNMAFDVKVIFQSATPEVSHEMADLEYRVINYTLDFQVQTWFFKPTSDVGLISKIIQTYSTDANTFISQLNIASTDTGSTITSAATAAVPTHKLKGSLDAENNLIIKYSLYEPSDGTRTRTISGG
jgi:hypothetical protein